MPQIQVFEKLRGEIYFYGPSDDRIREIYGGSDEKRTLILLDARPPERSDVIDLSQNKNFYGGNLYRMADELSKNYGELKCLPENSPIIFQYNFYYADGTSMIVIVYPHAISFNGTLYTLDYDEEAAAMDRVPTITFWEILFWRLSAGDWP